MHETTIRVRFDEVDSMAIVHHPRYLVYFEVARTRFLSDLGLPYSRLMASGTHLAVIETRTRYHRPARYEDEIVVRTRCIECGRTRIGLEYEVRRGDDVLATGYTRLAAVTPGGRACRLPPEVHDVLGPVLVAPGEGE